MSNPVHKIEIADQQSQQVDCAPLVTVVQKILDDHSIKESEISIAIVDDPTIRQINKQYLAHDYETDVISFVLEYDESHGALTGQLVVSTDTAARLAAEIGSSMQEELLLYVVHGTLHLVGFDDKDPSDAAEMRDAERRYLKEMGIVHRWEDSIQDSDDSNLRARKIPNDSTRLARPNNESDSTGSGASSQ